MRRLKSVLAILLMLWLPIQAAAAWAMPFAIVTAPPAVAEDLPPCHLADAVAAAVADVNCDDDNSCNNCNDCNNCAICHLASAGFLPMVLPALAADNLSVMVSRPDAATASFIGDPPQQPPRRSN